MEIILKHLINIFTHFCTEVAIVTLIFLTLCLCNPLNLQQKKNLFMRLITSSLLLDLTLIILKSLNTKLNSGGRMRVREMTDRRGKRAVLCLVI